MNQIQAALTRSKILFIAWCMLAAFGTYFCMYAFRKPFTAGTYSGLGLWNIHYKSILIISQVFGYMLSKFIGIKVISELKSSRRKKLIISLILFAESSLLLFGLIPYPYNFIFLFLNGLPLGMVWGIVFSYLEGRRFTEVLAMGLSISLIVSSGILKTAYFEIHDWFPAVTDFWMPALVGVIFLPLFLLFVWMLSLIPQPSETDTLLRTKRVPMTKDDKRNVLGEFGFGIICFVLMYTLLATMRDFRDNFSVEIWKEIGGGWDKTIFSKTELITGLIVLAAIGCLSLIRSNLKGFWAVLWLIALGLLVSGASTLLFQLKLLTPFWWVLLVGMGLFLAYIPMQVALFERMIAIFRIKANAGFFVYLCDAIGYLGSVALLLYKEFFMKDLSWARVLMRFSYVLTGTCLLFLVLAAIFFNRKAGVKGPITATPEILTST
jgi:MFS family permease